MILERRVFDLLESEKAGQVGSDFAIKTSVENIKALRQEIMEVQRKIKEIQETSKKHCPESDASEAI